MRVRKKPIPGRWKTRGLGCGDAVVEGPGELCVLRGEKMPDELVLPHEAANEICDVLNKYEWEHS